MITSPQDERLTDFAVEIAAEQVAKTRHFVCAVPVSSGVCCSRSWLSLRSSLGVLSGQAGGCFFGSRCSVTVQLMATGLEMCDTDPRTGCTSTPQMWQSSRVPTEGLGSKRAPRRLTTFPIMEKREISLINTIKFETSVRESRSPERSCHCYGRPHARAGILTTSAPLDRVSHGTVAVGEPEEGLELDDPEMLVVTEVEHEIEATTASVHRSTRVTRSKCLPHAPNKDCHGSGVIDTWPATSWNHQTQDRRWQSVERIEARSGSAGKQYHSAVQAGHPDGSQDGPPPPRSTLQERRRFSGVTRSFFEIMKGTGRAAPTKPGEAPEENWARGFEIALVKMCGAGWRGAARDSREKLAEPKAVVHL